MIVLSDEHVEKLIKYLATRPWLEAHPLLVPLLQAKEEYGNAQKQQGSQDLRVAPAERAQQGFGGPNIPVNHQKVFGGQDTETT